MIEKWFEAFTLMTAARTPDSLGAEEVTLIAGTTFRGALTFTAGDSLVAAGQAMLSDNPVLLYEDDMTLHPGDHVRREKDGAIYRVTGRGEGMRAPAYSGLRFAQTPVERLVKPC